MISATAQKAFFKRVGYEPFPEQQLYHNSTARYRAANCGRRFGKSTMAGRDMEPKLFLKDKLYWIVGPTYDLGEKEFRVIWNDLIVGQKLGRDKSIKRSYARRSGTMFIEFPWGTRVEVRSADHPENLVGDALDGVIMSEAAKHKEETWQRYIQPALADRRGFADFPTTPEGYNWYYTLWMLGQDEELSQYSSWRFPSYTNKIVFPGGANDDEIRLLRRTMSKESFAQEIEADFSSFVGKIYPEWDSTKMVKNVEFNPNWPNYIAFDWGYTNPLAAIEFQVSPDDKVYIWREHYLAYERVERHCEILRQRENPPGYRLDLCFGDAADPEAVSTVSTKFSPCIALPEAKTNWRAGVDRVRGFMEREVSQDEFGGPIYENAFTVDFKCVNTIRELNGYKAPDSVNGKNVQEIGIRQADHALDAIRYGLVHVFDLGATYHLTDVMEMNSNNWAPTQTTMSELTSVGSSVTSASSGSGGSFFTRGGEF